MVSVLLATTGRPSMAETCAQSLIATTFGHHVELIVSVDVELDTLDRITSLEPHERFTIVPDWYNEHRGCSRAWNDALALSYGDPIVLAADDLIFRPGWLTAALDEMAKFEDGWGFVGFNDGHFGQELSTHYMVSKRLIREHFGGVIAWECYQHSFNDCEANERARRASRYRWAEDARVDHNHWLFGERPQDRTDRRLLPRHPGSEQKFAERMAAGFPDDYDPVI